MSVFEQTATIQSWDEDYYHPIAEKFYDRAVADMLSMFGAQAEDKMLDAGCGPGVHSIRAARAGFQVQAIDISAAMLREAAARVADAGYLSRVTFQQADLTKLSLPSASVRYAFCWGVLIHIPEATLALDELARIMAPKGKLALYVNNAGALDHKLERWARRHMGKPAGEPQRDQLGVGTWYEMHGERLWVRLFDVPELVRQMKARGFSLMQWRAGEFSEIQRRVVSPTLRAALLYLNRIYYAIGLPAWPAAGNILVFEKRA